MDFDAAASTWMPSPQHTLYLNQGVTLTLIFDFQNLIRSSVCASKLFPVSFIEIVQAVHEISW